MNKILLNTLLAMALTSGFASQASATTINLTPDGQWHTFDVDNYASQSGGLEWIDAQSATGYNNDGSALDFKFTLTQGSFIIVADGGFAGDQFQVFDNGISLGLTSTPTNSYPTSIATNFDAALLNSNYSTGKFYLAAGTHDITGLLVTSATDTTGNAFNATVGAIMLVPEPQILTLLFAGFSIVAAATRRKA